MLRNRWLPGILFTLGIISLVFAVSDAPPTALMSAVGWAGYAAIIVGSVWLTLLTLRRH
jgi:hypothetical protein